MKVALILYSVREMMAKDPFGTVEEVAKLGYKYIEVCNHNAANDSGCGFGVSAEKLKSILDKYGAQVIGTHVFPIDRCDINAVVEYNKSLGNTNIANPMGHFSSYDDLMRQCEEFNRIGKICYDEGMNYLFHNHYHEYYTFDGKTIMDIIAENTDPRYLSFELDTFWVLRAGLSPVEQIKHFGKRIRLIHQKDFAWDSLTPINKIGITAESREMVPGRSVGLSAGGPSPESGTPEFGKYEEARKIEGTAFTEIGYGIMDIQSIIDTANAYTDAEYIILEQDMTRMASEMESIEKSMEGFRKFSGLDWGN